MIIDDMKKRAAEEALLHVKKNMVIGLGTGSTTSFFIDLLIRQKKYIKAVASSSRTYDQAKRGGIELLDINKIERIDLYVDGADEITRKKEMIKGGGGAFLKEKVLTFSSDKVIIIADETKVLKKLGKRSLPLEVLPFGAFFTKRLLDKEGIFGEFRKEGNNFYITDSGNYILDINISIDDIKKEDEKLKNIPGVLETGLFYGIDFLAIIAKSDGTIERF